MEATTVIFSHCSSVIIFNTSLPPINMANPYRIPHSGSHVLHRKQRVWDALMCQYRYRLSLSLKVLINNYCTALFVWVTDLGTLRFWLNQHDHCRPLLQKHTLVVEIFPLLLLTSTVIGSEWCHMCTVIAVCTSWWMHLKSVGCMPYNIVTGVIFQLFSLMVSCPSLVQAGWKHGNYPIV